MNDDQVTCEALTSTGKTSLDNGAITTDGAGSITGVGLTFTGAVKAGSIAGGQSGSAPATTTGGTISTAGVRVARVSPAGAITAVILQNGAFTGSEITVVNEAVAANSITFDVAGTSHVANGVSTVIAGLTSARFVWDSITALWYHCV